MKPADWVKALGPSPAHLLERLARGERTVGIAVGDDMLCQLGTDARHVGEQCRAGGVHIHAHGVDHALHHAIQGVGERRLVHIVLVQPHANGPGVDLDQLSQRVLGAAGNGDRPADGNIQVGEFCPR
jgi:hypothetical protein